MTIGVLAIVSMTLATAASAQQWRRAHYHDSILFAGRTSPLSTSVIFGSQRVLA